MLKTLRLSPKLEPALRSGHPWIYRNHLPEHRLKTGDWVRLECAQTVRLAVFEAEGAIALRIFDAVQLPDRNWLLERVKQALALRELLTSDTTAYRLIYGEADGLPGIVADKYDRYVVVKTYAASVEQVLPDLAWALSKTLKLKGVVWRKDKQLERLWGEMPPPELTVLEHGLKFIANLYEGQKTGLFLDQRENRQFLGGIARDKTVLNLFSYNGGFSVYALFGGARQVTSVDSAAAANRDAERNGVLNGFDLSQHETLTADVFELLQHYKQSHKTFDIVVLDPPSLAKDKASRSSAQRAYRKLNTLAMACVKQGGILLSASCTSQIGIEQFKDILKEAAFEAGREAQVIYEAGHALDHPLRLSFPEGRYLKCLAMRML